MSPDHAPESRVRRLILFVARDEPNSIAAIANLRLLRESAPEYLFELNVVDVLEQYQSARDYNVLVTPCLVLVEPPPRVVVVGTLRDLPRVRAALRLPPGTDGRDG